VTRRRRAFLLLGLAFLLGALAASDVAGRERALESALGRPVPVVVTRAAIPAGSRLTPSRLAVRRVPARYAPRYAFDSPALLAGVRAAVAIGPGVDVTPALVDDGRRPPAGPPVRRGERVAEVVARGSAELVAAGGRVDVLVTRDTGDGSGATTLALEDVEVLAAVPAAGGGGDAGAGDESADGGARVAVSLRVTLRQAVYLAAAQAFARELRVLPRPAGDRGRGRQGMRVGSDLG
jgi:pilus assembly protein CpaB